MELRTLRYFLTVAEELNITRAAEKLNMAQPPLSHQMHALEEELGVTLFLRGKRHLTLTSEGETLRQRAGQIMELVQKTKGELQTMKNGVAGTLYIGTVGGRAPYFLADWIKGFGEEYPEVNYDLWNGSTDDVIDRLMKGLVDVVLILTPYDAERVEGLQVGQLPWVAMIPADHPLAKLPGDTIPLKALVGQPLILPARKSRVQEIYTWFLRVGAEPTVVCRMSNFLDAYAMADRGVGISIFPRTMESNGSGVVFKDIVDPGHMAHYVLGLNRSRNPSELARLFVEFVNDMQQEKQLAESPRPHKE